MPCTESAMFKGVNMTGKFIVFDGLDGTGKSTFIKMLAEHLQNNGYKVSITAEPTKGKIGLLIREILGGEEKASQQEMAALFLADRIAHNEEINELLEQGYIVLCDRYYYSSFAYQSDEETLSWIMDMNLNCPSIRGPDLCLLFDSEPELCLQRISAGRSGQKLEIFENLKSLNAIREKFRKIEEMLKESGKGENIVRIDSSPPLNEVFEVILNTVNSFLNQ